MAKMWDPVLFDKAIYEQVQQAKAAKWAQIEKKAASEAHQLNKAANFGILYAAKIPTPNHLHWTVKKSNWSPFPDPPDPIYEGKKLLLDPLGSCDHLWQIRDEVAGTKDTAVVGCLSCHKRLEVHPTAIQQYETAMGKAIPIEGDES